MYSALHENSEFAAYLSYCVPRFMCAVEKPASSDCVAYHIGLGRYALKGIGRSCLKAQRYYYCIRGYRQGLPAVLVSDAVLIY